MKKIMFTFLVLIYLTILGCAASKQAKEPTYEAYCRLHATKATYGGTPDENIPYLECLRTEGLHEVEVKKLPPAR